MFSSPRPPPKKPSEHSLAIRTCVDDVASTIHRSGSRSLRTTSPPGPSGDAAAWVGKGPKKEASVEVPTDPLEPRHPRFQNVGAPHRARGFRPPARIHRTVPCSIHYRMTNLYRILSSISLLSYVVAGQHHLRVSLRSATKSRTAASIEQLNR